MDRASERIDVIEDCRLAQDDAAYHVAHLHVISEDRWEPGGAGREAPRHLLIGEERNGPHVRPPSRKGFGTRLLQRSLAGELGGEVNVTYAASGVVCVVKAPLIEHTTKLEPPSPHETALQ